MREYVITPEELGLDRCNLDALRVEGSNEAAETVRRVLAGEHGPRRDVAIANAAAALYVAGRCTSLTGGTTLAADAVDSGRAQTVLRRLVEWSSRHAS